MYFHCFQLILSNFEWVCFISELPVSVLGFVIYSEVYLGKDGKTASRFRESAFIQRVFYNMHKLQYNKAVRMMLSQCWEYLVSCTANRTFRGGGDKSNMRSVHVQNL